MWEKGNKGEFHSDGSTNIPVGCAALSSDWCTKRRKKRPQKLFWLGHSQGPA